MLIDPEFESSVGGGIDETNPILQSRDKIEDGIFSNPVPHVLPFDETIIGRPWRCAKDALRKVFNISRRVPPIIEGNWSEIDIPICAGGTVDYDSTCEAI